LKKNSRNSGGNRFKILIDNSGYELNNYGDLAMLEVACSRFHREFPDAKIFVFTNAVEKLKKSIPYAIPVSLSGRGQWEQTWNVFGGLHKLIPSCFHAWLERQEKHFKFTFPHFSFHWIKWRFNKKGLDLSPMREFLDVVDNADLVIASGGGFITDPFENHACRVLQTVALAQYMGKPTAMFGQGLGPVSSEKLYFWSKLVLPNLNYLTLREGVYSKPFALASGVLVDKFSVTGDDAITLAHSNTPDVLGDAIGINLRVASYSGLQDDALATIKNALQNAVTKLRAELLGIPISIHDADSDLKSLRALVEDKVVEDAVMLDTSMKVIEQAGLCRIVITGSYHAGVFALSQGVSVIGVAATDYYRYKFEGLVNQFGVGCQIVDRDSPKFEAELEAAIYKGWESADTVRPNLLEKAEEQINLSDAAYGLFMESIDAV